MSLQVTHEPSERSTVRGWLNANADARSTRGLPVVVLSGKGCPGRLLLIHEVDLPAVAARCAELTSALAGP